MTTRKPLTSFIALPLLLTACVSLSEFNAYKAETDAKFEAAMGDLSNANRDVAILLCESKVDAYEDMYGKDEPDPSRRDEPTTSRRDLKSCEAEYDKLIDNNNSNVPSCGTSMDTCRSGGVHSNQQCRTCYVECLNSGTWPTTGSPSCP